MSDESANQENKLDAVTAKYAESIGRFSNSKLGNLILDFVMFKRNIIQYTLQILYVLGIVVVWLLGLAGLIGKGPIGGLFKELVKKTVDGKTESVWEVSYLPSIAVSVLVIVFAPFVLHYLLEIVKFAWRFVPHCWTKVIIPIWETLVIRFFANVAPQIFPFLYERFMKVVDIAVEKLPFAIDAIIDGFVAIAMSIAALLKGVLWLPMTLCKRLARWADKTETDKAE